MVLSVIFSLIDFGDMFHVFGSMSAKTGFAPQYKTQLAEAAKVIGDTITSSPGLISAARQATCKAAVPFDTAVTYRAPVACLMDSSKASVAGPQVR